LVPRRLQVTPQAHLDHGHAPDYRWLVGRLQYVHVRDAWRLRFASAEDDDRHGGTVTLVETGPMIGFQTGQLVRIEGQLVDPSSRQPSPPYRVQSIQLLGNP
jgi:hypothetical protein